ncbi:hypothetical protein STENM327S_08568 [Streptomyces tendae]
MTPGNSCDVLESALDTADPEYRARREAMLAKLAELDAEHAKALEGGGGKYVERHRKRGKLLARERVELLLDPDTPFLELSPLAAWGSDHTVGASLVTGIGVVEGVECLITANDPTVRGGASNPWSLRKALRAHDIALANRLPVISLVESGGADLPSQKEIFIPGGAIFRDLTRLWAAGIPTVAAVFGNSTADVPGMSAHARAATPSRPACTPRTPPTPGPRRPAACTGSPSPAPYAWTPATRTATTSASTTTPCSPRSSPTPPPARRPSASSRPHWNGR